MHQFMLIFAFIFSVTNVFGQHKKLKLSISHLTGEFYVYTTYSTYENEQVPANGMYLLTKEGVVLFDTPWDTTQFQPLLDSIKVKHNKEVKLCIVTHWHSDKSEGLEYYKQKGIKTYTTELTDKLCKQNNKKRAEFLMTRDTTFKIGKYFFEVYYPGQGHTADNIVAWFNKEKILYGGCLIKGVDAENLGYLGDANLLEYETTLKKVQKKFPNPKYIVISHSNWMSINSLKHSIKLAKKLKQKT